MNRILAQIAQEMLQLYMKDLVNLPTEEKGSNIFVISRNKAKTTEIANLSRFVERNIPT